MADYNSISNKTCLEIHKIKSKGTLTAKMNHNMRLIEVKNADEQRTHFDEELIKNYGEEDLFSLPIEERRTKIVDFSERFDQRIGELDYYKTHEIRENAVLALEVNLTYSPTAEVPVEEWKQANLEWLQDEFNVAGDGKNNILSCVYHGDENNGHIHAIIVPINEKGKLCARDFTGGWSKMVQFQDRYAMAMQRFGLERGTHGSEMEHERVRKFYADANKVLDSTPKPLPGESAQEYFDRYREQLETAQASQYMKTRKECEERKRTIDAYVNEQRQIVKTQYAKENEELQRVRQEIAARERRLEEKEKIFETRKEKVLLQRDDLLLEIQDLKELRDNLQLEQSEAAAKIREYDKNLVAYDLLAKRNPELVLEYDHIEDVMDELYNDWLLEQSQEETR